MAWGFESPLSHQAQQAAACQHGPPLFSFVDSKIRLRDNFMGRRTSAAQFWDRILSP